MKHTYLLIAALPNSPPHLLNVPEVTAEKTSGSAIAEGPREALVSRNPATTNI